MRRRCGRFVNPNDDATASIGVFFDGTYAGKVVIKQVPLAEENRLLCQRWVKRNADEVSKASGGKLGYVHIPGMNDGAFRTTFEDIMGKYATRGCSD